MTQGPTMRIAELVAGTKLTDMPPDALQIAKDSLFNVVGVALAGSTQPAVKKVIDFVKSMGGSPTATVLGVGFQTSPWAAALVNGTSAAALDYDENSWRGLGHFTGPHLGAALAVAEMCGASGATLLEAHAIAFETANKIGRALQPGQYFGGWHSTGTIGVLSSAAVCAKILGLDASGIATAIGIAASTAGGLRGNFGTMTKGFHSGAAAANGVMSALLAQSGFTARQDIIEAENGYAATTVKDGSQRVDEVALDWADPWDVIEPGPDIKFQPSGSMSFCAGQLAVELAIEHDIDSRSVRSVLCKTTPLGEELSSYHVPRNATEAQYSTAWAIAVGLTDRKRGLAQFSEQRVRDKAVLDLASRVEIAVNPELASLDWRDLAACELTVLMNDGRQFTRFLRRAAGHRGAEPWTHDVLEEKFRETASWSLSPSSVERAIKMLRTIETVSDVRDLTAVLISDKC
jgi:2-methylcitrate dehydratase PrpD